jgi:GAF domain-containing protein
MQNPVIPADEAERLTALHALNLLDTPDEERFDRITRLVARLLDVPISLITLVDADRQWAKSVYGFSQREAPRNVSFCAHAILESRMMVVPDTRTDPRFADNPLVTGEPHVRFYAGQPLSSLGRHRVGVLCVIDDHPRELDPAQAQILADLAIWAERELDFLEADSAMKRMQETNQRLEQLNKVRGEFVHIVSHNFRTALTGIQGFSEMIRDQEFTLAEIHEFAGDINEDARRLNQMITELLEVDKAARLNEGQK